MYALIHGLTLIFFRLIVMINMKNNDLLFFSQSIYQATVNHSYYHKFSSNLPFLGL